MHDNARPNLKVNYSFGSRTKRDNQNLKKAMLEAKKFRESLKKKEHKNEQVPVLQR